LVAGGLGEDKQLPTKSCRRDGRDVKDYLYLDLFEDASYMRVGVGYTKVAVESQGVLDRIWSIVGWSGRLDKYRSATLSVGRMFVGEDGKVRRTRSIDGQ